MTTIAPSNLYKNAIPASNEQHLILGPNGAVNYNPIGLGTQHMGGMPTMMNGYPQVMSLNNLDLLGINN